MKIKEIKNPFGLDKENSRLVHIGEIKNQENISLVCPSCLSPVIPVRGKIKQPHFRHNVPTECGGGLESSVHLAAKQIIKERKKIALPQYGISGSIIDSKGKPHTKKVTITEQGTIINFNSVEDEIALFGIKADILAKTDDDSFIIEIFYRHQVDELKREKIIKANISAIEIDLSGLTPESINNWEYFWEYINDPKNIKWLHHSKVKTHGLALELWLKNIVGQEEKKYIREENERKYRIMMNRRYVRRNKRL